MRNKKNCGTVKITLLLLIFCFLSAHAGGQTISLDMPNLIYTSYAFVFYAGEKEDTVATGRIDKEGKAVISIPASKAGYCGAARLKIQGRGERMMIVCREQNFSVFSQEMEDMTEVSYNHSSENEELMQVITKHRRIVEKYGRALSQMENYSKTDKFYKALEEENASLQTEYAALLGNIAANNKYAARMMEILLYMTGNSVVLGQQPAEIMAEQRKFITEKLNFNALYTSGFWTPAIGLWFEQTMLLGDSALVTDAKKMLARVDDVVVQRALMQSFIDIFSRYSMESLLPEISSSYAVPIRGNIAPAIINGNDTIMPKNALIVFYDSNCGTCHDELRQIIEKYSLMQDNHMDVYSIAADTSIDTFSATAQKIVWKNNFCDFKGFDGVNFINYGVVGTPTIILVDREGILRGRYARAKDFFN
ncbi:MAG: redoxin domain-containing protein [Bacteroidales bacterium]|jgi:thioredoxin-related protein|nr:redoxin domain-containing protein [Bacteroidales bacterium]